MKQQNFQTAELRDENNNIVQQGAYGRKTPLTTGDNQGWIDFVMNNLEWLKANGITVNQIATQAEAEAGTDNAKVMTPLRVKNAIDKQRPGIVYSGLSDLGLDATATENDIRREMAVGSIFSIACSRTSLSLALFELKNFYARITFYKMNYSEFKAIAIAADGSTFVLSRSNNEIITASMWHKLATNGALSMPSGENINITPPTIIANSTSYEKINNVYTAPADGWVHLKVEVADEAKHEAWVNTNGIYKTSVVWSEQIYQWLTFPLAKGQYFNFEYKNISSISAMIFVYAQSEV